jgi:predicted nucleic acid-binding protein
MKRKVFIDTDIIYDLLAKRGDFYFPAAKLFTAADEGIYQLNISALSIANIHYFTSKEKASSEAKEILRRFKVLVEIVPLTEKIIDLALNSDFDDFEDALQYYSAIQSESDILLTRNLKDYRKAQITVLTAQDFINL